MGLLKGKVGIITAAGSGIGRQSALVCAKEGATVVVSDVIVEAGEETVRLIEEAGGKAAFIQCDVTNEDEVRQLVRETVGKFGKLDFAHNNAGIGAPNVPVSEVEKEDWRRVMHITLEGTYLCMKHQIPAMLDNGGGAIVNTSSSSGLVGTPLQSAYSSAKFGVNGLTKTAALEYGSQGIRVNSICPGVTKTPAVAKWLEDAPDEAQALIDGIPMKRMSEPVEQANAVAWLCSDRASYVTGVALSVDGGLLAQ